MTAILFGIGCASIATLGLAAVSQSVGKRNQADILLSIGLAGVTFALGTLGYLAVMP